MASGSGLMSLSPGASSLRHSVGIQMGLCQRESSFEKETATPQGEVESFSGCKGRGCENAACDTSHSLVFRLQSHQTT